MESIRMGGRGRGDVFTDLILLPTSGASGKKLLISRFYRPHYDTDDLRWPYLS